MKIFQILFILLLSTTLSNAQDVLARHTVAKGETVTQIAQRYKITPHDIYQMNPNAKTGIRENDVLLIPAKNTGKTADGASVKPVVSQQPSVNTTHVVKPKETMFGIAKQYGVTVDDLKNANPILSEGLKVGQTIKVQSNPGLSTTTTTVTKIKSDNAVNGSVTHVVQSRETKFGIAKKYGITVAELERQNPDIVQGLQIGHKLTITGGKPQPVTTEISRTESSSSEIISTTRKTPYANYEVKPKETMFSLTQMFGITETELIALNPALKDGVRAGMILKVPGKGSMIIQETSAGKDLIKSLSTNERKHLAMLLPFNAGKIQGDSLKSLAERLKKDAFLNMTLDFYSGALMAIDSAKTLGLNVDVRIYDSEESRLSSNIEGLVKSKQLDKVDAVIGPFYQQYAEQTAELLSAGNVPVISPMSKEAGKPRANLFQAMPSEEIGKRAVMDYMMSKGGNIIIVNDPKRASTRDFIKQNYPLARFAEVDDNGGVNIDNLKSMLVKDRTNYIVLDTERTGMILSTTNFLLNEMANYTIQLAILEQNDTLDFEEVSMKRLTILKLLYPSMTRENHTPEAVAFENAYKRENKVFPSQYAVRGFDVTFDTLIRLSQEKEFPAVAAEVPTERIESQFKYVKNGEGHINSGVYILQYNEDLSVTEAQ